MHTVSGGDAEAVAVRGGRIAAVGSSAELGGLSAARVVELEGRTVLPGFQDAHLHPFAGGMLAIVCNLHETGSAEDCLEEIARYAHRESRPGVDLRRRLVDGLLLRREPGQRAPRRRPARSPGLPREPRRPHGVGEQPRPRARRDHGGHRRSCGRPHRAQRRRRAVGRAPRGRDVARQHAGSAAERGRAGAGAPERAGRAARARHHRMAGRRRRARDARRLPRRGRPRAADDARRGQPPVGSLTRRGADRRPPRDAGTGIARASPDPRREDLPGRRARELHGLAPRAVRGHGQPRDVDARGRGAPAHARPARLARLPGAPAHDRRPRGS